MKNKLYAFWIIFSIISIQKGIGQISYFEKYSNLVDGEEAGSQIVKINEEEALILSTGEVNALDTGWHMLIRKIDSKTGSVVFKKDYAPFLNYAVEPYAVTKTTSGNYTVAGAVRNQLDTINTWAGNVFIAEMTVDGDVLWSNSIGVNELTERGVDIIELEDGGYIVIGTRRKSITSSAFSALVLKTNSQGDSLWTKIIGEPGGSSWRGVIAEKGDDNAFYMAFNRLNDTERWAHVVKMDGTTGDIIWNKQYELGLSNGVVGSALSEDGELVISSAIREVDGNCGTWALTKIDAEGEIKWSHSYENEVGCTNGNKIIRTNEGGYATCLRQTYPQLAVVDEKGNYLFSKIYDIEFFMSPHNLIQLEDGSFLITGYEGATSDYTNWLIRTDPQGDLVLSVGKEIERIPINIYPNPTTSYFQVDLPSNDSMSCTGKLANNAGVLLDVFSSSELLESISVEHLAKGIYYFNLFDKDRLVAVKKIIIQ